MKLIAITCKKGEKIFAFYFFTTVFICNTIYMESAFAKLDVKHQGAILAGGYCAKNIE